MQLNERLEQYIYLVRLDKPIGILLLLWPTLWAIWLAGKGHPQVTTVIIFICGVIVTRSLGCIINDYADREFDKYVARTRNRPLASGKLKPVEAMVLAAFLTGIAFVLVLFCNWLTIELAFAGLAFTIIYPLLKRYTSLPQLGLGVAFSWGVPMAFAAEREMVTTSAWFLFATGIIWPIAYDTIYAMIDRNDDIKIGVKSTAILFDEMDTTIIALLQILFLVLMVIVGLMFHLRSIYYISLIVAGLLFIYQQWLIKNREREYCFLAFQNNNWVGLLIFLGIMLSFHL